MSAVDLSTYGGALLEVGYVGQVVDLNTASIISRTNESATAIDFGKAVAQGASDNTIKPVDNVSNRIVGISVRHPVQVSPINNEDIKYERYASVPVIEQGRVYATPAVNVARGDSVYVVIATQALTNTSNSNANPQVLGAVWETTTAANDVGVIRINRP